jgi:hypothetical protein
LVLRYSADAYLSLLENGDYLAEHLDDAASWKGDVWVRLGRLHRVRRRLPLVVFLALAPIE